MPKSMTAYGRGEAAGPEATIRVEIRSLNHRFLDLQLRLPKALWPLEDQLRKLVVTHLNRGRVEILVTLAYPEQVQPSLIVNRPLLAAAIQALNEIQEAANLTQPWGWDQLLAIKELISISETPEPEAGTLWPTLATALESALTQLDSMRRQEGDFLAQELLKHLTAIGEQLQIIREQAALVPETYHRKLAQRLEQLLPPAAPVEPQRLAQEVALLADRADITEELERMESHCRQFREALAETGPVGRKLDFLLQEMHREMNTIGSKAAGLPIITAVIAVKGDLEKLREQVQNLE